MKLHRKLYFECMLCVFWLVCMPNLATASEPELRFGSVAMDIPVEMHKRLTPLMDYLSDTIGRRVVLKLSPNMHDAIDEISKGEVAIAYLTPVAYINSHNRSATRLVAKTVTDKRSTFRLMIVVREDSPVKSVKDLKGKLFAFGDKAALLQRAVVADAIPLNQLGAYKFIGHYDNIAQGVMNGDFDAGILKDTTAYAWQGKGLRILYESPDLPPYNIAVSANVDDKLFKKLQQAFLKLDVNDPKQREVIHSLDKHYDGFAATSDQEYDVVRRLIAPFVKAQH